MEIQKRKLSAKIKQPEPVKQPGRKISSRIKIKPKQQQPEPETETICFDGLCTVKEKPVKLEISDVAGMSYKELVSLFQRQAAYHELTIPNDWRGMVNNFTGFLKSKYSGEHLENFGDLSNMTVITDALKKFMK